MGYYTVCSGGGGGGIPKYSGMLEDERGIGSGSKNGRCNQEDAPWTQAVQKQVSARLDKFDVGSEKVMYAGVVAVILASRQRWRVAPYVPRYRPRLVDRGVGTSGQRVEH